MQTAAPSQQALKVPAAAQVTGLSEKEIRNAISTGELPAIRVGTGGRRRHLVIRRESLDKFMTEREEKSTQEARNHDRT